MLENKWCVFCTYLLRLTFTVLSKYQSCTGLVATTIPTRHISENQDIEKLYSFQYPVCECVRKILVDQRKNKISTLYIKSKRLLRTTPYFIPAATSHRSRGGKNPIIPFLPFDACSSSSRTGKGENRPRGTQQRLYIPYKLSLRDCHSKFWTECRIIRGACLAFYTAYIAFGSSYRGCLEIR